MDKEMVKTFTERYGKADCEGRRYILIDAPKPVTGKKWYTARALLDGLDAPFLYRITWKERPGFSGISDGCFLRTPGHEWTYLYKLKTEFSYDTWEPGRLLVPVTELVCFYFITAPGDMENLNKEGAESLAERNVAPFRICQFFSEEEAREALDECESNIMPLDDGSGDFVVSIYALDRFDREPNGSVFGESSYEFCENFNKLQNRF